MEGGTWGRGKKDNCGWHVRGIKCFLNSSNVIFDILVLLSKILWRDMNFSS